MHVAKGRPPGRRPRDAERTRHDILLAAGRRFARREFSRVTLREIAEDVGVTPALVVRYFGSKLALFDEVARGDDLDLPPLTDGDHWPQLLARARGVLEYYQDDARAQASPCSARSTSTTASCSAPTSGDACNGRGRRR